MTKNWFMCIDMELNQALRIGILASSGYGKTYLTQTLIKQMATQHKEIKYIYYNTDFESLPMIRGLKNVIIFEPDKELNDDLGYLNTFILDMRSKYSNCMLIIDDLDLFFDGNSSMSLKSKELKNLFSNGRHQRFGCIWMSKALKYIPKKVISNTDVFFIGNFVEKDDIDRLRGFVDINIIRKLTKPVFLRYDRRDLPNQRMKLVKA